MLPGLMFRGENYYSSVLGETPMNCRYSEQKMLEKNGKYTERDVKVK